MDQHDESKELEKLGKELRTLGMFVTYFPMEQKWMAFNKNYLSITKFHWNKIDAMKEALANRHKA